MQFEEKCDYTFHYEKGFEVKKDEDISPHLKLCIKDIVKREGFTNFKITVKVIPTDGGNYLARLFEINIYGTTKSGFNNLDIFVKHIVPDEMITIISITDAYKKEVYAYTELLKIYDKLQTDAKVPHKERFKIVKSYEESSSEFIILENMNKNGYSTLNRLEPISYDFARLSVEQMAKFHALSFVLQREQPEYYDRKIKCQKHCFTFDDEWNKFIENFIQISMQCLDDEMKHKVEKIIPVVLKKYPEYHLKTDTEGTIEEVILIDYQLIQYGCPINDFFYFIFGATDREFRRAHLEDLKNIYHDSLTKFLKYFDMDVNLYFSRKTFDRLYKERLDYGLLLAVWFLPILLVDGEDIPDFSKQPAKDMQFKTDKRLKGRLEGVVHDYMEWGYL
ncbi:uncharacterized protein LOC106133389 [Amyelois transitella]|uniref:uncharacterized protein LOC106133389 n=1 Tax=Amyelois transitella TaxID=680683 RepID=UPI00298FA282|nr:uncharacterized protein LOC106133389 [Amyelois transitella]